MKPHAMDFISVLLRPYVIWNKFWELIINKSEKMKKKKLKNLELNFEKVTISRLKQTSIHGGVWPISRPTEQTCACTFCEFDDC